MDDIDGLKQLTGISDAQLNSKLGKEKLWKLAGHLGDFELYAGLPGFNFNNATIASLRASAVKNGCQHAMREALKKWSGTCRSLVEILMKLEKRSIAEEVCKTVVKKHLANEAEVTESNEAEPGILCSYTLWIVIGIVCGIAAGLIMAHDYEVSSETVHSNQTVVKTTSKTLPYISDNFVGREDDMQELLSKINFEYTQIRIIGILGSAGFGKSTLAIQFGHRLTEQGVHVYYVDFNDFSKRDVQPYLAEKILQHANDDLILSKPDNLNLDMLLKWARNISENTVLIMDNCDTMFRVPDAKTNFTTAIEKLVKESMSIKVVTTSREEDRHIEYYSWYKIKPLSLNASVLLLENKLLLRSIFIKILLNEKEEIANLTGNVPLALHIVGALLTQEVPLTPETIINELKSDPISVLSPEDNPIQFKINASIALSFKFLDDHLKKVAIFLSCFPGSFDKNASIKISKQLHKEKMLNIVVTNYDLKALVSRSLLEYNKAGQGRYQYHRLIQKFLKRKMTSDLDLNKHDFFDQFNDYYLNRFYEHTRKFKYRYIDSLKFLDTERHNIYGIRTITIQDEYSDSPIYASGKILWKSLSVMILAINQEYLQIRYTHSELLGFLQKPLIDAENAIDRVHKHIDSLSEHVLLYLYDSFFRMIKVYTLKLLVKIEGFEAVAGFMKKRKRIVDNLLLDDNMSFVEDIFEMDIVEMDILEMDKLTFELPICPQTLGSYKRWFYFMLRHSSFRAGVQHSKLIENYSEECPNCSNLEVAFIYRDLQDYVESARYYELSLKEHMQPSTKFLVLSQLYAVYIKIEEKKISSQEKHKVYHEVVSKEVNNTVERMHAEILKLENKNGLSDDWNLILDVIRHSIYFKISFDDIEKKFCLLFSKKHFQLNPFYAFSTIRAIVDANNRTKTLLWGSLILKPFEDYTYINNYSAEDTLSILKAHYLISEAHLFLGQNTSEGKERKEHTAKGCKGMKHFCETINERKDLRNYSNMNVLGAHKSACSIVSTCMY